jgi:hypothetical protein
VLALGALPGIAVAMVREPRRPVAFGAIVRVAGHKVDPQGDSEQENRVLRQPLGVALQRIAALLTLGHYESMSAYSEVLRKKLLASVTERGMKKSESAHAFEVSTSSVKRYVKLTESISLPSAVIL